MIKFYRKKPVVIEAVQWDGTDVRLGEILHCMNREVRNLENNKIGIETLEGMMEAAVGDFIIKGVQGEFYPCKPDIFEQTYLEVQNKEDESASMWHKMDWDDTSMLQDHHYYLVTIPFFETPMKAKWHAERGGHWEVFGVPFGKPGNCVCTYHYEWEEDEDERVIAWMKIPDKSYGGI